MKGRRPSLPPSSTMSETQSPRKCGRNCSPICESQRRSKSMCADRIRQESSSGLVGHRKIVGPMFDEKRSHPFGIVRCVDYHDDAALADLMSFFLDKSLTRLQPNKGPNVTADRAAQCRSQCDQ